MEYSVSSERQQHEQEEDYQDETVFNISLPTLINCLNMCGAGGGGSALGSITNGGQMNTAPLHNTSITSIVLYFPDVGKPLRIWSEEDGMVSGILCYKMCG